MKSYSRSSLSLCVCFYFLNFLTGTLSPTSLSPFKLMYWFWTHKVLNPKTLKLPLFTFRFFFFFCVYAPCVRKSQNLEVAGPTLPFRNLGKCLAWLLTFETLKPRVLKSWNLRSHLTFSELWDMFALLFDIWNPEFWNPEIMSPTFSLFNFSWFRKF